MSNWQIYHVSNCPRQHAPIGYPGCICEVAPKGRILELEAANTALSERVRRLKTAIRSISEHNHPLIDMGGVRTIWTIGCPACNRMETLTAALNEDEKHGD